MAEDCRHEFHDTKTCVFCGSRFARRYFVVWEIPAVMIGKRTLEVSTHERALADLADIKGFEGVVDAHIEIEDEEIKQC